MSDERNRQWVLRNRPTGVPPTYVLHVFGGTGLTAYFGLLDLGRPEPGETVVVSGAAGATGSVAGQIAKIKGSRVIGIAGGPQKCAWLTERAHFGRGDRLQVGGHRRAPARGRPRPRERLLRQRGRAHARHPPPPPRHARPGRPVRRHLEQLHHRAAARAQAHHAALHPARAHGGLPRPAPPLPVPAV